MLFNVYLTSPTLAENKVVGSEECTKRTGADCVHGTGFEINEDSAGNIFVAGSLEGDELVVY